MNIQRQSKIHKLTAELKDYRYEQAKRALGDKSAVLDRAIELKQMHLDHLLNLEEEA